MSRSLRGNVDRNSRNRRMAVRRRVVPYVGTWIEIVIAIIKRMTDKSFPTWERG